MKVEMKVTFTVAEVEAAMKDLYVRKFGQPPAGFRLDVVGAGYRAIGEISVQTEELPEPVEMNAPMPVPAVEQVSLKDAF